MKLITLVSLMLASTLTFAYKGEYPKVPEAKVTPGSLCDHPDEYRYPERIAYCKRDVTSDEKREIFDDYRRLGYGLDPKNRPSYKIDHYIPLCAGGSNHPNNLWPQHVSVYNITDPMEALGCVTLQDGKIAQAELIRLFKLAKNDLSQVQAVMKTLKKL